MVVASVGTGFIFANRIQQKSPPVSLCDQTPSMIVVGGPSGSFNGNVWTTTAQNGCEWQIDYTNASFFAENSGAKPAIWLDSTHAWLSSAQQYLLAEHNGTLSSSDGWHTPLTVYIIVGFRNANQHDNHIEANEIIEHSE